MKWALKSSYFFLSVILVLFTQSVSATVFIETPIEDRLQHSSGVIRGKFLGKVYKKLPSGKIVTEATIKVSEFSGLEQNEIINHHNFKVMYPGGVWLGRVYKVHGTPSFTQGQEVVLIVKKGEFGYVLPNMALSKFDLETNDKKVTLKSSVFPDKKGVGHLSLEEFSVLVEGSFGEPMHKLVIDKYVDKGVRARKINKRQPASMSKEEKSSEDENIPVMWFVIGLGILGFFSNHLFKGKGNES